MTNTSRQRAREWFFITKSRPQESAEVDKMGSSKNSSFYYFYCTEETPKKQREKDTTTEESDDAASTASSSGVQEPVNRSDS